MPSIFFFFFFNDTATTEIYTLSLHDALPILAQMNILAIKVLRKVLQDGSIPLDRNDLGILRCYEMGWIHSEPIDKDRSEEHTSELQSQSNLVCRLLLEKKKSLAIPTQQESVT